MILRFILPFLVFFTPLNAQEPACLVKPSPSCLVELAKAASANDTEGWGISGLYEMLLSTDPDLARREKWLEDYISFASTSKIEGIRERLPAVKAEYYARIGKFEDAYKALGLLDGKEDPNAEPSVLIIDEARALNFKQALPRVAKMVEEDSRDDVYLELLNVAIEQKQDNRSGIVTLIKDPNTKRLANSTLFGARADLKAFLKEQEVWLKSVKQGSDFPFDTKDNATRETWDAFLQGAILAGNKDSFSEALATRGAFATVDENESVGKMVRPLIRKGLADWLKLAGLHIKLPAGENVAAEEDMFRLKHLTIDQLKANLTAVENIPSLRLEITDQIVDIMAQRGMVSEAIAFFNDKGRLDEVNKATDSIEKGVPLFETLYRMAYAKKLPEIALLKAKVTNEKAVEFYNKINGLNDKINLNLKAPLENEPNEEDWSLMMDLLLHEGDAQKMALVSSRIKDAGLKTAAFTQTARMMLEKP